MGPAHHGGPRPPRWASPCSGCAAQPGGADGRLQAQTLKLLSRERRGRSVFLRLVLGSGLELPPPQPLSLERRGRPVFFAFGIYSNYKMLWNKIMGLWVPTAVGFYCGKVLCKIILQ